MKFVTCREKKSGKVFAGWLAGEGVVDMATVSNGALPDNMLELIRQNDIYLPTIRERYAQAPATHTMEEVDLLAPIPNPPSFRDSMCFKEHCENIGVTKGKGIQPAYFNRPIFYFSNHNTLLGPSQPVTFPKSCRYKDYEFEIGILIGKPGRDITPEESQAYIFGYTILCDWSARDLQMVDQQMPLGPHKGKDFATTIGPCIVTADEVADRLGPDGRHDLKMEGRRNGEVFTVGNFKDIYWTPGDLIAVASADVDLYPGDLLGSGTIGKGSLYELSGEYESTDWLKAGDTVTLEVEKLGRLDMTVRG